MSSRRIFIGVSLVMAVAQSFVPALAHAWTLVYSNDVLGELEPCGCRTNPSGGLARKANWLSRLPDKDLLQVDAGDLLFETTSIPESLQPQAELQATRLLNGYDLMGHHVIVPGEKDFALGVRVFEKLRRGTRSRFLAANLYKKKKGGGKSPLLEPHALFKKRGQKVAILGLVGTDLNWPSELHVDSPVRAAQVWVPRLRKTADIVIVVTHQGFEADKALAETVPGIDLIVGAHSQTFLQTPTRIGKTLILQSSYRNQYVGAFPLDLPLNPEKHSLTSLDAGYDTNPPNTEGSPRPATVMDLHVASFKQAVARLNEERDAQIKRETAITQFSMSPTPSAERFQTWPRCAECHLKQFDFWRKTPHAQAYHSLFAAHQHENRACLSCHSVGMGEKGGFDQVSAVAEGLTLEETDSFLQAIRQADSLKSEVQLKRDQSAGALHLTIQKAQKSWVPVQCENCHQAGAEHPTSGNLTKSVSTSTCFQCHTAERAPSWYTADGKRDEAKAAAKLKSMTCPAGTTTVD